MDEKNNLNQKPNTSPASSGQKVFSRDAEIEPILTARRSASSAPVSHPVSAPKPVSRESVTRPKPAAAASGTGPQTSTARPAASAQPSSGVRAGGVSRTAPSSSSPVKRAASPAGAAPVSAQNPPQRTQNAVRTAQNPSVPKNTAQNAPVRTNQTVRPAETAKSGTIPRQPAAARQGNAASSSYGPGFSTISYQKVPTSGISHNASSSSAKLPAGQVRKTTQGQNLPAVRTAQTPSAAAASGKKRPAVSDDVVYLEPGLIGNETDTLKKRKERGEQTNSTLSSLLKAVMYIVFILVASGFLSYFGISAGNDVFALMKSDVPTSVTITDSTTIDELADLLKEENVIRYPSIFRLYAMLRKDKGIEKGYVGGTYTVSPANNYDTLLDIFKGPKTVAQQVRITIPEGYTVDDIINLFVEEYSMGTREGFINAIQYYDFDYWFVKELTELPEGRKYRLEGYLYPDTYYFYSTWSEARILSKILDNFENKFDERYIERCKEIGMTVDEVVTLASMIQMEAKYDIEYANVSSVFHNRLNNPYQTAGKLQSDATIQYVLDRRHEELTVDDLNLDSRYNTYMYPGLPAGPITNPTTVAINYALFPAKTSYYYFVAQKNGYTLFASTLDEHEANKLAVRSQG